MDLRNQTLSRLSQNSHRTSSLNALVGLDGFVDLIVKAVDQRFGPQDAFEAISTIETFGQRILSASGKSTNIELYQEVQKLGGNGPILANALLQAGTSVRYVGNLGEPEIHPVFENFARKTQAISIGEPALTHAIEFEDGKIILGSLSNLDELDYQRIIERVGEGAFFDLVSRADLIALVNWTMLPHMTAIVSAFHDRVLNNLGPRDHRTFFFDLADPAKRADGDLIAFLRLIGKFQSHGQVILGLNLKEAQHVAKVLNLRAIEDEASSLKKGSQTIREELKLSTVVIHPTDSAACATRDGTFYTEGFYSAKPKLTTGAGDHFNAGFCLARMLNLAPDEALLTGCAFSGYYVRTGKSPSLSEIEGFLRSNQPARRA